MSQEEIGLYAGNMEILNIIARLKWVNENITEFGADSFGSGNLLLTTNFATRIATCEKMSGIMTAYEIDKLYPGYYFGVNPETKQQVDDIITLSKGVLSGKLKGEENPNSISGLSLLSATTVLGLITMRRLLNKEITHYTLLS